MIETIGDIGEGFLTMHQQKKIVIVGSGPGGLASAMLLASKGFKVKVFEKMPVIGGRTSEISLKGYRFDVGPTFLMMKYLLDELFMITGRKISDYLDCHRLDPMYRLQFSDKSLTVSDDREKMKKNIESVFPGESEGLDRFFKRESIRFERLYPCLQKEYGKVKAFASMDLVRAVPHVSVTRSLYEVMSDYFESEELRLAFTFQSKYLGMSPWSCPGLFAMIPYTEHAHGVYHVMGGLSQITKAFAKIAKEEGAEILCSSPVKEVKVISGRATGVVLEDGSFEAADEVVVNADFGYAVNNLFPKSELKKWTPSRLDKLDYSCSTYMLYLGLDKKYECEHHTIFFAKNYRKNLEDIENKIFPENDFSVYVRNASILDGSLAPEGHSALYILVPMPNNQSKINWEREAPAFRERVLEFLEANTPYKNIKEHIKVEEMIHPGNWEHQRDVYKGATFNMGHSIEQMLYFRPHNKFEEFENCYLVGGGTHPGSGLPTIFESARISSALISKKYDVEFPKPIPFRKLIALVEAGN